MAAKRRRGDATQPEAARTNRKVSTRLTPEHREAVEELAARHELAVSQVLTLAIALALREGALEAACVEAKMWSDALGGKKPL